MTISTHIPLTNNQLEQFYTFLQREDFETPLSAEEVAVSNAFLASVGFYIPDASHCTAPGITEADRSAMRQCMLSFRIKYYSEHGQLPMEEATLTWLKRDIADATTLSPIPLPSLTYSGTRLSYLAEIESPGLHIVHLRPSDALRPVRHGVHCRGMIDFVQVDDASRVIICKRCGYYLEVPMQSTGTFTGLEFQLRMRLEHPVGQSRYSPTVSYAP